MNKKRKMKRKIAALLMGTTLSVAVCGYSVQAMTYGYDMGGKVFISEDSSSSNLTEEEKEKTRREYLDRRGVPDSFRW